MFVEKRLESPLNFFSKSVNKSNKPVHIQTGYTRTAGQVIRQFK